jgi:hypothetical protein
VAPDKPYIPDIFLLNCTRSKIICPDFFDRNTENHELFCGEQRLLLSNGGEKYSAVGKNIQYLVESLV